MELHAQIPLLSDKERKMLIAFSDPFFFSTQRGTYLAPAGVIVCDWLWLLTCCDWLCFILDFDNTKDQSGLFDILKVLQVPAASGRLMSDIPGPDVSNLHQSLSK